jgi:release factor glutamine methyltransferase
MTVRETLLALRGLLVAGGIGRSDLEADRILESVLSRSREFFRIHPEAPCGPDVLPRAAELAGRRIQGEPLAYVLGEAEFFGLPFFVGPGCLVPRPETELLVEAVLSLPGKTGFFADWGTGSGCLLASILKERPDFFGWGVDAEASALAWAGRNLQRHGLTGRSKLVLEPDPTAVPIPPASLDFIVTNPPYIPRSALPGLMREVRDHEPLSALDGGAEGMDLIFLFLRVLPVYLRPGGALLMETGGADQVKRLVGEEFPELIMEGFLRDYGGIPRHVRYRRR